MKIDFSLVAEISDYLPLIDPERLRILLKITRYFVQTSDPAFIPQEKREAAWKKINARDDARTAANIAVRASARS